MHKPYKEIFKHNFDFKVKYRFYKESEGGRKQLPFQGIRSDFSYVHPDHHEDNKMFMIWPEFEDSNGNLIENGSVLEAGTARMWIINPEMRPYHQARISVGTVGHFREGIKTGECEVIEIKDLMINPKK